MLLLSVVSARPNFVKLAAVVHAIASANKKQKTKNKKLEHLIVHTGQHYDPLFSDIFFEQLAIPTPAYNLGVSGDDREDVIDRTEAALMPILEATKPDIVLVYGDVNGALGAAWAARKMGIRIGHVEAGLRSFDQSMPEERNRIGVDELADFLFCTEQSGIENLRRENVPGAVHLVGNTMIDTLIRMMPFIDAKPVGAYCNTPLRAKPSKSAFAIVTLHRPSNVDTAEALAENLRFLGDVAEIIPLVLPAHHRLRTRIDQFSLTAKIHPKLSIIDALGYIPFLRLLKDAAFIITDSGGIQEEAVFLQKKCFTLRLNTERPVTIESGSNTLIAVADPSDRAKVLAFAADPILPPITIPPLWDGRTGERITEILSRSM